MTNAARLVVGVGMLGFWAAPAWGYTDCRKDFSTPPSATLDDDSDGQCDEGTPALSEGCCACVNLTNCSADGSFEYRYQEGSSSGTTSQVAFSDCDDTDPTNYAKTWYADSDDDGHGDPDETTIACSKPSGYVGNDNDCDDDDEDRFPGNSEVCDDLDNDCDDSTDEDDVATDAEVWYLDYDDDGDGDPATTKKACDPPSGYVDNGIDCDDSDPNTYFSADERCDGKNTDCTSSTGTFDSNPLSNVPAEETDDDSDGYVECCDYGVYTDDGMGTVSVDNDVYAWASAPAIGEYGWSDDCFPDDLPDALDAAGVAGGGDCDDTVLTGTGIHPGLEYETCECSGTGPSSAQRDTDCNGDLNTYIDSRGSVEYTSTPADAAAAGEPATCSDNYYVDCDADGYAGDISTYVTTPQRGPKVLCDATEEEIELMVSATETIEAATCEEGATVLPESTATDCNDRKPEVHVGLDEVCDGLDNDCDNLVDELEDVSDRLTGSMKLYLDGDKDGQGVKDESGPYLYLCNSLGEGACAAPSDGGTVVEVDFASPAVVGGGLAGTVYDDYYDPDGDNLACYVSTHQDCNDRDDAIFKREESYELLDGKDNDCTSGIPLVELDCDQDGFLTGGVALGGTISNDLLELTSCSVAGELTSNVQCWGGSYIGAGDIVCDEGTGLWQLPVGQADPDYVDIVTSTLVNVLNLVGVNDCDDRCADRYPGHREVCDGIDNDCTLVSSLDADANENGIPDAMEMTLPGYVDVDELDMDDDGYLSCASETAAMNAVVTGISSRSCSDEADDAYEPIGFDDPLDLCARVVPSEGPDGVCDGIGLYAGDDADETDGDHDDHMTCGVADLSDEDATESIFALVYVPADLLEGGVGTSELQVVPLIEPRREPMLDEGDSGAGDSAVWLSDAPVRACDGWLSAALDDLVSLAGVEASSDDDGTHDRLFDVCIQAQSCYEQVLAGEPTDAVCETLTGRCTVVEITFDSLADQEILNLLGEEDPWPEVAEALGPACVSDEVYHEDELIVRSVWSQERIVESRRRVVEWECFRLFGTYGCGDLSEPDETWTSPYRDADGNPIAQPGGHFSNPAVYSSAVWSDPAWWKELGRFDVAVTSECLGGCWTDDPLAPYAALDDEGERFSTSLTNRRGVSDDVGGDCEGGSAANRDEPEGPDDLLAVYLDEPVSCDTCLDNIDNNCNGLTDCEDPGCAICFVGQGVGCGSSSESPCRDAAGCSSVAARPSSRWPLTGLAAGLVTIAGLFARRRRSA